MADSNNLPPQMPFMFGMNGRPSLIPQTHHVIPNSPGLHLHTSHAHATSPYFAHPFSFDRTTSPPSAISNASSARRRSQPSSDQVKHRRTRSGCFTCRNRRVKCDETHPTCNRCRKGNRACVYPDSQSGSRSAHRTKTAQQHSESSGEEPESAISERLPSIPDEDYLISPTCVRDGSMQLPSASRRHPSKTPSLTQDESPSPSTEGLNSIKVETLTSATPSSRRGSKPRRKSAMIARSLKDLSSDVQFYLEYYRTNVSYHHYGFKSDEYNFMKGTLLKIAMQYDPLLSAITGFSAYLHTLTKPDGKMSDFLGFYNRSVSLLRLSLQRNPKPSLATLLTMLQLATMEEFLGDWVNLVMHQKAAFEIVTSLFSPETVMRDDTFRKTLQWYTRFDLYASLMSGSRCVLGREWFDAHHKYYVEQVQKYPDNINLKYEEHITRYRLMSSDMSTLLGQKDKGQYRSGEPSLELDSLAQRVMEWQEYVDPALTNDAYRVPEIPRSKPPDDLDIADPYEPHLLFRDELFATNLFLMDVWAINLMFQSQIAALRQEAPSLDIVRLAYKVCQVFEAVELYPHSPPGAIFAANASFGIAVMYLPKDEKHILWAKKKFALIESGGFIYPSTFRARLSALWSADLSHWWLPNEEGLPPIIRSIREFIQERNALPRDRTAEDLHSMKGLFRTMSIGDTALSPPRTGSEGQSPSTLSTLSTGSQGGLGDWLGEMD